ncbi:MAG: PTS system mannose/fructose/sorbose family transporter subunit IID [Elusimicrobiales bacterium]|nr:PTS system mannose/fructose/sorbose family transporter subunit IID [Elusimicrobiales bacterium]
MLSRKDILITFLRSLFLQSSFNFERYQNIGFLYAISYFLRKSFKDSYKLKDILKRHSEIFNTQPYLSGFVIGNILRMEIDLRASNDIYTVKQSLACTYASIGDRMFWSRIRVIEACSTLIIFLILYYCFNNYFLSYYALLISAFVPTLFYAFYTVYLRYFGIILGFKCGGTKNCGLDIFNWNKLIKTLSKISLFLIIICGISILFIYGFNIIKNSFFVDSIYLSIPILSFLVQRFFRKDKKNIFYPICFMIFICFILAFFTVK